MVVGILKEIKNNENRVSATPACVASMIKNNAKVLVENNAGLGSGFENEDYLKVGAQIIDNAYDIWQRSDLILKVKEPLESEYALMKYGQSIFTYLHLAPNQKLTSALLEKNITAIAYETVQLENKSLPLLAPMSEVAGRMSVQIGAMLLQKYYGGRGVLLGGVPGVMAGEVLIIGGGIVGANAAKIALGMGAKVTIFDISKPRLMWLDDTFSGKLTTLMYNEHIIAEEIKKADLVISGVLVAGAKAPKVVSEEMVKNMKQGAVIVDVAIDQGGSIETIDRITTHDNPCYEKHGVVHYSVANIPGAVPRTSTFALTSVTLPYIIEIIQKGVVGALQSNKALLLGLNTYKGKLTNEPVAIAQGREFCKIDF